MKKQIKLAGAMLAVMMGVTSILNAQSTGTTGFWDLKGNSGTNTTDNFVGTADNVALSFRTNNANRMRISSSGSVGIGTTSPASRLHVYGTTAASLTSNGTFTVESNITSGMYITKTKMRFDGSHIQSVGLTGAGTTLFLNENGGNIGIGTASTSAKFHVENSSDSKNAYFNNDYSGSSTKFGIYNVVGSLGTGSKFGVYSTATDIGTSDAIGVKGVSNSNTGNSYGVHGEANGGQSSSCFAVRGDAKGNGISVNNYGVYGAATGGGAVSNNYGVFGTASGASNNWAGYLDGKAFASELRVGSITEATGYKLSVDGKVICEELKVQNSSAWPDYVFADDYNLIPIEEMEKSIKENKHLPGIPSACEVEENGLLIGQMQNKMMEKIEQLSLYVIELKHQKDELGTRLSKLENK